jgi:hypothetical protein
MHAPHETCFGYQIRPANDGWAWVTFDLAGEVQEQGWAPQKALAAAFVIRALARAAGPEAVLRAA